MKVLTLDEQIECVKKQVIYMENNLADYNERNTIYAHIVINENVQIIASLEELKALKEGGKP